MAKKIDKTNAARLLDQAGVEYELIPYVVDENNLAAEHIAEQLEEPIEQVFKTLVLCGATAPAIRKAVEEAPGYAECGIEIVETQELGAAVAAAQAAASEGDVVILSPACAAFDQFKNFMERGKVFKHLVNEL